MRTSSNSSSASKPPPSAMLTRCCTSTSSGLSGANRFPYAPAGHRAPRGHRLDQFERVGRHQRDAARPARLMAASGRRAAAAARRPWPSRSAARARPAGSPRRGRATRSRPPPSARPSFRPCSTHARTSLSSEPWCRRDLPGPLGPRSQQHLVPDLGLRAHVGEDQRGAAGLDLVHRRALPSARRGGRPTKKRPGSLGSSVSTTSGLFDLALHQHRAASCRRSICIASARLPSVADRPHTTSCGFQRCAGAPARAAPARRACCRPSRATRRRSRCARRRGARGRRRASTAAWPTPAWSPARSGSLRSCLARSLAERVAGAQTHAPLRRHLGQRQLERARACRQPARASGVNQSTPQRAAGCLGWRTRQRAHPHRVGLAAAGGGVQQGRSRPRPSRPTPRVGRQAAVQPRLANHVSPRVAPKRRRRVAGGGMIPCDGGCHALTIQPSSGSTCAGNLKFACRVAGTRACSRHSTASSAVAARRRRAAHRAMRGTQLQAQLQARATFEQTHRRSPGAPTSARRCAWLASSLLYERAADLLARRAAPDTPRARRVVHHPRAARAGAPRLAAAAARRHAACRPPARLTHFIDGLEPAGRSHARCANCAPPAAPRGRQRMCRESAERGNAAVVAHASKPIGGPSEVFHQRARQAERKVEATHPVAGLMPASGRTETRSA